MRRFPKLSPRQRVPVWGCIFQKRRALAKVVPIPDECHTLHHIARSLARRTAPAYDGLTILRLRVGSRNTRRVGGCRSAVDGQVIGARMAAGVSLEFEKAFSTML